MNTDDDNLYMKRVWDHDSDDGRWLRWMDAICFPEYEPFEFNGTVWHILEYNGIYVGYCGHRVVNSFAGELCRAGVLPDYRGEGHQRYMIKQREEMMKFQKLSVSISTAHVNNHKSINNLFSCGYKATSKEEWPMVETSGKSMIFFKKNL